VTKEAQQIIHFRSTPYNPYRNKILLPIKCI